MTNMNIVNEQRRILKEIESSIEDLKDSIAVETEEQASLFIELEGTLEKIENTL